MRHNRALRRIAPSRGKNVYMMSKSKASSKIDRNDEDRIVLDFCIPYSVDRSTLYVVSGPIYHMFLLTSKEFKIYIFTV